MVRVRRARRSVATDSIRFMTRHLLALTTVALVFFCVSVYFFVLGTEVSTVAALGEKIRCFLWLGRVDGNLFG